MPKRDEVLPFWETGNPPLYFFDIFDPGVPLIRVHDQAVPFGTAFPRPGPAVPKEGPEMSVYDHLEFKHLKYIIAIAEEGTFTAAAARLPLAQSALSRQIAELEDAIGIQIFDRSRAGVMLTDAGEALLGIARDLLQTRIETVDAIRAVQQVTLCPFRVGFTPFVAQQLIGAFSAAYKDIFPRAQLIPHSGDTEGLIEGLKRQELDAALVTLPVPEGDFVVQPIMHEPLVVCLRKDDPLAKEEVIKPADLSGRIAVFIDPRHHRLAHARLLEMLDEQGIRLGISKPNFNPEHVQWMVRERHCFALVRESEVLHSELTTRPILDLNWTVDSAMVYQPQIAETTLPLLLRQMQKRLSNEQATTGKRPPRRSSMSAREQSRLFNESSETR